MWLIFRHSVKEKCIQKRRKDDERFTFQLSSRACFSLGIICYWKNDSIGHEILFGPKFNYLGSYNETFTFTNLKMK